MLQQLGKYLGFVGKALVAALGSLLALVNPALHHFDVCHHQFQVDDVHIPQRICAAFHMGNVGIFKAAYHMDNSVGGADVAQELVAQTFALGRAFYQTGDVHELNHSGGELLGVVQLSQPIQPLIRHADYAYIGVNGAERIVIRRHTCVGNGIEKSGFSHVGKSDDT